MHIDILSFLVGVAFTLFVAIVVKIVLVGWNNFEDSVGESFDKDRTNKEGN